MIQIGFDESRERNVLGGKFFGDFCQRRLVRDLAQDEVRVIGRNREFSSGLDGSVNGLNLLLSKRQVAAD